MPGGQVISPDYSIDAKGFNDILQTTQQSQMMNQLLQARVQSQMNEARLENAQIQQTQQEIQLKQQMAPSQIRRMNAEASLTESQIPQSAANTALIQAQIPRIGAETGDILSRIPENYARTGLINQQTSGMAQQQGQSSQLFPSELSLSNTKSQLGTTEYNKAIFDNVMERIQKTDQYKDYLDTKEAGKHIAGAIASQHPEIPKDWFSLYGSAVGAQKAVELSQQLGQSKQIDLQNLQMQHVINAMPQVQQQHKLEGFMTMLNQSLSSAQPDASVTALLSSPTFKGDPDLAPVVQSAQTLYSKYGSAKNMENMITAGMMDPDPNIRQGALITQYAWHGKRIPMTTVQPDALDPTGAKHTEIDIKALQATDPFLAKYAQGMLRGNGGGNNNSGSPATTQPTKLGTDQSNPILVKTIEDIRAVPKGQWYKTPSGNLRQAL